MRLRDFPCFSDLFVDFVENVPGVAPFLERLPSLDSVMAAASLAQSSDVPRQQVLQILEPRLSEFGHGNAAARNIRRLAQPETVVVLVSCPDSFAGGPLFQFLKFLTAAKLAAELESNGIGAVPVCWIEPGTAPSADSPYLLDSDGQLRPLGPELQARDPLGTIENPLAGLASLFGPSVQPESMEFLTQCYTPGVDPTLAAGQFMAGTMQDWGFLILDGRDKELHNLVGRVSGLDRVDPAERSALLRDQATLLRASKYGERNVHLPSRSITSMLLESLFPVAARVVDQREVQDIALIPALLSRLGFQKPRLWPRASATILDTRSSKILQKYGIEFLELFRGPDEVLRRLAYDDMAEAGKRGMDQLTSRIGTGLSELHSSVPPGDPMAALVEDARKRMEYQVAKLRELFTRASNSRREDANRQVRRVCDRLAPRACPQELLLAGLNFIMRYSPVVLRILFHELEVRSNEHQLINVE